MTKMILLSRRHPPQSTGLLRTGALPSAAFNLSSTTSHRPSRAPQHSPTQSTSWLPAVHIHQSTVKSAPPSPPPRSHAVAFNPFFDTVNLSNLVNSDVPACKRQIGHTFSTQGVTSLIEAIFMNKDEIRMVRNLRRNDAQTFVDVIYEVRSVLFFPRHSPVTCLPLLCFRTYTFR